MVEKRGFIPEDEKKDGFENEPSFEVKEALFKSMDKKYQAVYDHMVPRIPGPERGINSVVDKEGKEIARIEKFRNPIKSPLHADRDSKYQSFESAAYGRTDSENLWIVVDFDDVINNTTSAYSDLKNKLAELGLAPERFDELYSASKKLNAEGKKILKFNDLVNSIKEEMVGKEKAVDQLIDSIDYSAYINQAVKRSLQACHFIRPGMTTRITILTYGDFDYQKMRIDQSGITDIVDDVVYTQGSKSKVLQALKEQEYTGRKDTKTSTPILLTFDDSPQHIDDYDKNSPKNYYHNIRFHHPQAKRYGKDHFASGAVVLEETDQNKAALNMHYCALMTQVPYNIGYGNPEESLKHFRNPAEYKEKLYETLHL